MALSRADALEYLELPIGADPDSIRTSYKRLAQKWFPEKHGQSSEAKQKFHKISLAFKRLTLDNEYPTLSEFDMFEMYNRIVQPKTSVSYTNGYDSSDDEDDEDDDSEEDILSQILKTKHNKRIKQDGLNNNRKTINRLTPEEIERNAKELITEEEKEKKKAEKRRAKKKRQREKKRQEKQEVKDIDTSKKKGKVKENGATITSGGKDRNGDSSGGEAEGFDPSAAFFTEVKSKKTKGGVPAEVSTPPQKPRLPPEAIKVNGTVDEKADDIDPVILRSRQLAIQGNQMAGMGHYTAAIDLFTDAIKLDPKDFRFFGNRSYCFDRVQQYDRALKDADKAIMLAPDWPKGYFRKGRALAGLKLFADAEQAFMQVLKLDKNCEDAITELGRVRTHQLTEMGFTLQQAEQAIRTYGSVQAALDSLLAGVVAETSLANEIYESDDEDYSTFPPKPHLLPTPVLTQSSVVQPPNMSHSLNTVSQGALPGATRTATSTAAAHMQPINRPAATRINDIKMDPANPEGLTALWVGNVLPDISQTKLLQMFQKYGTVTSIRMLPEKYCAFINFKTKESAGRAMGALQDQDCGGQRLLIKFPDNPVATGSVVLRKGATTTTKNTNTSPNTSNLILTKTKPPEPQQQQQQPKSTGPVNGDECYFWRTTGCQFGKACHYKHMPEHKGIDRKPWQQTK